MITSSVFLESLEDLRKALFLMFRYLTRGYLFSNKFFPFLNDKTLKSL